VKCHFPWVLADFKAVKNCAVHIKSPKTVFLYAFSVWLWMKWSLGLAFESCLLHIKLKKINFYMHVFNSARLFCLCNAYKKRKNGFLYAFSSGFGRNGTLDWLLKAVYCI